MNRGTDDGDIPPDRSKKRPYFATGEPAECEHLTDEIESERRFVSARWIMAAVAQPLLDHKTD